MLPTQKHHEIKDLFGHLPFRNRETENKRNTSRDTSGNPKPRTFQGDLTDFLMNFTLDCYNWFVLPDTCGWEVFIWSIVHILGAASTGVVLTNVYMAYQTNPTVTALKDTLFPIGLVPFPAISICNNNRISLQAAVKFALTLSKRDPESRNETFFLEQVRFLGKLFDSEAGDETELTNFQVYLDGNETLNAYDVRENMKQLSPSCDEMLLRCFWRGVERPCMEKGVMFEYRSTQYGHCCTFNYVRPDYLEQIEPISYFVNDTGPELGLILLLKANTSDYFYPFYNILGFIVQVFNPNEFPDVPSGSVTERVVVPGYETFIRIDSNTFTTDPETRRYSSKERGCLFTDEMPDLFGDRYKRSDCVVICRIASIAALCGCQMFFLPLIYKTQSENPGRSQRVCTLEHLQCLNQFRIKWLTMLLSLKKVAGLEFELENGLYCPECLPSCSDTVYRVTASQLPLLDTFRKYPNIMTSVKNVSDVALVRIYLGQPDTWLYKQTVSRSWFEVLGNLGGLCGLITGFSLVTVAEVVYFVAGQFIRFLRTKVAPDPEIFANKVDSEQEFYILP